MATIPNLNGIHEALPSFTMHHRKTARIACLLHKNDQATHVQATRRVAIGLASIALLATAGTRTSLAQDNGFWITGPIPVPYANNSLHAYQVSFKIYNSKRPNLVVLGEEIDNEETGTRSFLKKGIYIANIGNKGRMQRLRRYAFDLLAMADLIAQEDAWNYVRRYLRLKSTFMYYDFDEVISAAPVDDDKKSLTDLANRLFDSFETLLDAVKRQDVPQIYSRYQATTPLLQEVMTRMA